MKVLVTGGAGFIGSHIVDKLIAEDCRTVIIDNLSTGSLENVNQQAQFVKMDIRSAEVYDFCLKEKFDYIIHLAAQTMVPQSIKNPGFDCNVNVAGTVNLLEAARKTGVKRFIAASSAAVYGDVPVLPIEEDSIPRPASFYGLSKLTMEKYMAMYNNIYGLEYVVLRYANVYGERQGDFGEGGVISIFTGKIAAGQKISIFGDGSQTRDFVYVGDVANANFQALTTEKVNAVYNISTQTEVSVETLVEILSKVSGKDVDKAYLAAREGDIYRSMLSNAAAQGNLQWKPQTRLIDGLTKTYEFIVKNSEQ